MNIKGICGSILAVIVGLARIIGGVYSISTSRFPIETLVGVGLIAIGLYIIVSITVLLMKKSLFWLRMLYVSVFLFWVDGIANGFLLYGSPQISGQIINLCCVMAIMMLSRSILKNSNP